MSTTDNRIMTDATCARIADALEYFVENYPVPTLIEKTITENGIYNASSDDTDGYSSVTVNVSGSGGNSPKLIASYYFNGGNQSASVSHTFASGEYTILISALFGKAIDGINVLLNGIDISENYSNVCDVSTIITLKAYASKSTFATDDVLTVSNKTSTNNTGVQIFVFEGVEVSSIAFYNITNNNGTSFNITSSTGECFLEVAKFGYYDNNNTIPVIRIFSISTGSILSTATPNASSYWYGGTYVLKI